MMNASDAFAVCYGEAYTPCRRDHFSEPPLDPPDDPWWLDLAGDIASAVEDGEPLEQAMERAGDARDDDYADIRDYVIRMIKEEAA